MDLMIAWVGMLLATNLGGLRVMNTEAQKDEQCGRWIEDFDALKIEANHFTLSTDLHSPDLKLGHEEEYL